MSRSFRDDQFHERGYYALVAAHPELREEKLVFPNCRCQFQDQCKPPCPKFQEDMEWPVYDEAKGG